MSLPRLTFLCHSSLPNNICQILNLLPQLRQITCNHHGVIQTRCEYHGGFLDHFSWTDARVSKIERSLWKMMSSIIFVTTTSLEWQVIEIARQNTNMARVADPRRVLTYQIIFVMDFDILFWDHISSFNKTCLFFCFFIVLKAWDVSFKCYFDKIFWSSSNMWLRLINPKD